MVREDSVKADKADASVLHSSSALNATRKPYHWGRER
jgi:hypothetical protein